MRYNYETLVSCLDTASADAVFNSCPCLAQWWQIVAQGLQLVNLTGQD